VLSSNIDNESVESRALGAFETAQALTNAHTPFNIVAVLPLRNGPDEETLRLAVDQLQQRHPLLRSKLEPVGGGFLFSPTTRPISLEGIDRANDSTWVEVTERELGRPLDTDSGPLARCLRIAGSVREVESEVVLTFHHSIMDATSGANVVRDPERSGELEGLRRAPPGGVFSPEAMADRAFRRGGSMDSIGPRTSLVDQIEECERIANLDQRRMALVESGVDDRLGRRPGCAVVAGFSQDQREASVFYCEPVEVPDISFAVVPECVRVVVAVGLIPERRGRLPLIVTVAEPADGHAQFSAHFFFACEPRG